MFRKLYSSFIYSIKIFSSDIGQFKLNAHITGILGVKHPIRIAAMAWDNQLEKVITVSKMDTVA